jgi:putative lipoprotein
VPTPALPTPVAPSTTPPSAPPGTGAETATVTGMVTYRERMALTPEAVIQVDLRDLSNPDTEAPPLARQIIEKPGQVPVAFALSYALASIDAHHAYVVSARITDRGQLQFVTEERVPVITNGAPPSAEIVVVPVR